LMQVPLQFVAQLKCIPVLLEGPKPILVVLRVGVSG